MREKNVATLMLLGILLVGIVQAVEYTQTLVEFNIPSVTAYTLTLLGEAAVTSDPTASSAPTTMIYFNSTDGNSKAVEAHVAGGSIQSDGNPIFTFDNTGTVNLTTLGVYLNGTAPTCVSLLGKTAYAAGAGGAAVIGVTNATVATNYAPAAAAQAYYLWANFTGCASGQYYRQLISAGD